jgi:hypothetical protein
MAKSKKIRKIKEILGKPSGEIQNVLVILSRTPDGVVEVASATVIQIDRDLVIQESKNRGDIDFWKSFDSRPIVEQVKKDLSIESNPGGKIMQMPVQSIEAAESIKRLYKEAPINSHKANELK